MARPPRTDDWVPVTARMTVDAARRLRLVAADRGVNMGRILDDLVMTHLPPMEGRGKTTPQKPVTPWEIQRLDSEMEKAGVNQSDLARVLGIRPRAVSEWFERGHVPDQRQAAVQAAMAKFKKSPPRAPKRK